MGVKIIGCTVQNVGTIVRAPDHCDIYIDSSLIENVRTIADIYQNDAAILQQLGISSSTPKEVLQSAIQAMRHLPNGTEEQRLEIVEKSSLKDFISTGANLATISTFLYELSKFIS